MCNFTEHTEDSVVRSVCLQELLDSKVNLPFTIRSTWLSIQLECPDLRRTHVHLNREPVQLLVRRSNPFQPKAEWVLFPDRYKDTYCPPIHPKSSYSPSDAASYEATFLCSLSWKSYRKCLQFISCMRFLEEIPRSICSSVLWKTKCSNWYNVCCWHT